MGRLLAVTWPALLAWYLAGSLVRASVLALAAPIGPENALAALLLLPLAVLARLISYIGMFLSLRRGLRNVRPGAEPATFREAAREFLGVLISSIGPFFTLYAVIGLLQEDFSAYAAAAFRQAGLGHGRDFLNPGDGPLVLAVVVIAFAGRVALKVLAPRLPAWTGVPSIYLEATWVFVALTAIGTLFGPIIEWISSRQVVHWVGDAREFLTGLWEPIRLAFVGIDWAVPVALQLVLLPLAWLLIAGIVLVRSLPAMEEERLGMPRALAARWRAAASRIPPVLRRWGHLVTGGWDETGRPLTFVGRIILRAGPAELAILLGVYGVLSAAGVWLQRAAYFLVGPHDSSFWYTWDPILVLAVSAIVEPVRIALLAVAFDVALGRWLARRRQGASSNRSSARSSAVTETSTVADSEVPSGAR